MENIINLKTYQKYKSLVDAGLILLPDKSFVKLFNDFLDKNRTVKLNQDGFADIEVNAKKISISSRGSLRTYAIDGKHYDSVLQAACSIYDPYDEFIDLKDDIKINPSSYSFIPIIDTDYDKVRYTISKYSKALNKYFNPHNVIKAVYSVDTVLFYVNDNDSIKKYCFAIEPCNPKDMIGYFCKEVSKRNGLESEIFIAFFYQEEDLPFTYGTCKEDFYLFKDILNKIIFKGSTPLKYMLLQELKDKKDTKLKTKENILFTKIMDLKGIRKIDFCKGLGITPSDYDNLLDNEQMEVLSSLTGKKVSRKHINKFLNIKDNITDIKYYESQNLIWKVNYKDIPNAC